jgi:ribosomal protein S18 acetylase RimI-like enzyme
VCTGTIGGPADVPAICDLLYEYTGEALPAKDLARRLEEARGLETVFLAEVDGTLAGLLVLRTVPTLSGAGGRVEITELYVRPGARRRGVGTALVNAAVEYSRSCNRTGMHLLVDPANEGAHCFYGTLGFRRDSWDMRRDI